MTRFELNEYKKQEKINFAAAGKANLIVSLSVLVDEFEFSPEDLNRFMDAYNDVLDYYNSESKSYGKLLDDWNNFFYEYAGIKIM